MQKLSEKFDHEAECGERVDAYAFARAADMAREHEAATGWRPIAEAPKDGSLVITGWWPSNGGDWYVKQLRSVFDTWRDVNAYIYSPTHYLPSPPPPEPKP